ncbi:MAG: polysaccharide biosynthesis/export family protein [Dysgonamonadaceae bacterium]|jgi:polysaccharide export outer membrane protein|nr:polysaccharide biosynthesis/export family protein [Dysgonamonadaceae bacterium]
MVASCTSYKKVPYFQMKDQKKGEVEISSFYKESSARFQPDDILAITVNLPGSGQAVAFDFNLPLQPVTTEISEEVVNTGIGRQTYMVDKEGKIDFPIIGQIRVIGYTANELQRHLKNLIYPRLLKEEPVVTVRLINFRIIVTGEVNRPGQISVPKDHINLLEALALAGDMTLYGRRDNIELHREMPDGSVKIVYLDISKSDIISSPYYYLHQNDVIYVVPNKVRAQLTDINPQLGTVMSIGSFLMSLITFALWLK